MRRRLVPSLVCVVLCATITFAQAVITMTPKQATIGQPLSVTVTFASFCRVGLIDYGDGSKDVALLPEASNTTHGQHTYAQAGWYSIKTFAATGSSAAACQGGPLTVQVNGTGKAPPPTAPPTSAGAAISMPSTPLQAGHPVTIVVRYNGSCAGAKISYGDGSPDQPLVQGGTGSGQVKSHVYAAAGTFNVQTYFAEAAAAKTLAPGLVATYTANCKGGPVPYTVMGATNPGSSTANTNTPGAPTQCNDGTASNATGKGACAHHGGVKASGTAAASTTPTPPPPNAPPNSNANASPTTTSSGTPCNDGTFSNATGKGACAHHGGIKSTGTAVNTPAAPSPAPNANTNSTGTTVSCKDGTTVTKAKGACKGHGGYADSTSASPN